MRDVFFDASYLAGVTDEKYLVSSLRQHMLASGCILKEKRDEEWNMAELFHTVTNRRAGEKHIAYAESHDQALVGDKTIAFRLMDADMYWHMSKDAHPSGVVDRGLALNKMIRLITFALGGEGYLNFMGNEFGHPEWIDFPREGNGFSYRHARRQWSLVDNALLRYGDLAAFDRALMALDVQFNLLADPFIESLHNDEDGKFIIFQASEDKFWRNFCQAIGREDLLERGERRRVGDHARGDEELRAQLSHIFAGKSRKTSSVTSSCKSRLPPGRRFLA